MSPEPTPEAGTKAAPASKTAGADVVRIPRPAGGPGRGGPFGGMNIPAEKAMNFWPSAKRLLGKLRPERAWLLLVLAASVISVALQVIGPRLLGEGTNLIFAGVVSKQLPAGVSKEQL
ncbi:MAG: ABC transporter ATP-binding protein, partial [Arthrobacter sp.]